MHYHRNGLLYAHVRAKVGEWGMELLILLVFLYLRAAPATISHPGRTGTIITQRHSGSHFQECSPLQALSRAVKLTSHSFLLMCNSVFLPSSFLMVVSRSTTNTADCWILECEKTTTHIAEFHFAVGKGGKKRLLAIYLQ